MSIRIAPTLALVALASPAWADPQADAPDDEAPPSSVSNLVASGEPPASETASGDAGPGEASPNEVCSRTDDPPASDGEAGTAHEPNARLEWSSLFAFVPASEVRAHRPLTMKAWARDFRHALSLREFIETSPLVVAGLKLYLEAEPVAVRQQQENTSQLTVAVAPDRVVVLGVF